jgi:hypothetical protein
VCQSSRRIRWETFKDGIGYGHCHLPLTADHYPSSKSKAVPPDKYAVLSDVLDWATDAGYPGYSNAAIDEAFNTWVINTAARDATIWLF